MRCGSQPDTRGLLSRRIIRIYRPSGRSCPTSMILRQVSSIRFVVGCLRIVRLACCIAWFTACVVSAFPQKRQFLKFFTGSDRVPLGGLGAIKVIPLLEFVAHCSPMLRNCCSRPWIRSVSTFPFLRWLYKRTAVSQQIASLRPTHATTSYCYQSIPTPRS